MKPLLVRAFGRFWLVHIPNWLDRWLQRRYGPGKVGDSIKIKLPR